MTLGAITLLVAIVMSLVQDDYRRLLAFCAISQVGFILLGIGSGTTIGAVGALFHMVNHATYKSCLFLTAGAVERQGHSTKLSELGGLRRRMPVTFACFLIAAASGAGVPLFAGFFSKELIFDAALESGTAFYLAAVLGSFLTTLALLRLGHAAFFGKPSSTETDSKAPVKEAPVTMLIPMVVMATGCVLFGVSSRLPVEQLISPMLPMTHLDALKSAGHHLGGWPENTALVAMTVVVLIGAALSHWFGVSLNGGPSQATAHIRQSPGLSWVYDKAERRWFDPYDLFMKGVDGFAKLTFRVDRATDWLFVASARLNGKASFGVRAAHRGNTSTYIVWSLLAATLVILYLGL
jgi:NADH-quinone oxidoreductase subunit L